MKYKNVKIENISKRILTTALTLTLITTSLTGCTKDFKYERTTVNGKYVVNVSGDIDYKTASKLKVMELNVCGENILFLARKYETNASLKKTNGNNKIKYQYLDVFEDFKIIELSGDVGEYVTDIDYENPEVDFVKETDLDYYLNEYGLVQRKYSFAELKYVFDTIQNNYEFKNGKTLIKK